MNTTARAIRLDDELWESVGTRATNEGGDRTQIIRNALTDYTQSVELWEDNAGGLYLAACGKGYALLDGATPAGFQADAQGWADADWNPADELDTVEDWNAHPEEETHDTATGDQTQHVATWTPSGITLHRRPGGAASNYIGIEYQN